MEEKNLEFDNFARLVIDILEEVDIEYLIGGSVAVWAWGEPRTTGDLDVVLRLSPDKIMPLSQSLKRRNMLVPPDIIIDLLIQPGDLPVNAIHLDTGYKAEMFLLKAGDAYREVTLSRRKQVDLGPPIGTVYVHSPEDLILNKMIYYGLHEQTKHIRDIASIFLHSTDKLDLDYINSWAGQLNITDVWHKVLERINEYASTH